MLNRKGDDPRIARDSDTGFFFRKEDGGRTRLLEGRVAFVTGGGSGIGRAAAERLAAEGAKVFLLDVRPERLDDVRRSLVEAGAEVESAVADVSIEEQVRRAVEAAVRRFGRLDFVFANAGVNGTLAPVETMPAADWSATLAVNLTGTFLTVKHAIPHMKKLGGSIAVTSSINGTRVFSAAGLSAYAVSKAGQVAFVKMAAFELARYRIRVNAICPGWIRTNIAESTHSTPELRHYPSKWKIVRPERLLPGVPGSPDRVADVVVFLASDLSRHVSGTEIYVDAAESLL